MRFDPSWIDSVDVNVVLVQVVGWRHEAIWNYPNLAAARKAFPDLDPHNNTTRFTAAMPGGGDNGPTLRFETWAAYEGYSE